MRYALVLALLLLSGCYAHHGYGYGWHGHTHHDHIERAERTAPRVLPCTARYDICPKHSLSQWR